MLDDFMTLLESHLVFAEYVNEQDWEWDPDTDPNCPNYSDRNLEDRYGIQFDGQPSQCKELRQVVDMWRSMGIQVAQVAEGDF